MPQPDASVLNLLRADLRGATLLANLRLCDEAGLFSARVEGRFVSALGVRVDPASSTPADITDAAIDLLEELAADYTTGHLGDVFRAYYGACFPVARVVSNATLQAHYLASRPGEDSFGNPTLASASEIVARDPELGAAMESPNRGNRQLRSHIRLCPSGGQAFVTRLADWDALASSSSGNSADLAVAHLGLPYPEGELLDLLRVSTPAAAALGELRRPTIFDALEHSWWVCWKDDPLHLGHTADLNTLEAGALGRGGAEWVAGDAEIPTGGGHVQCAPLGATTQNTLPGIARTRLQHFRQQVITLSEN